jgi:hypothetical protein
MWLDEALSVNIALPSDLDQALRQMAFVALHALLHVWMRSARAISRCALSCMAGAGRDRNGALCGAPGRGLSTCVMVSSPFAIRYAIEARRRAPGLLWRAASWNGRSMADDWRAHALAATQYWAFISSAS